MPCMWFGIDKNGVIFEATSGGCANIPAFVINSKEDNERLNEYFLNLLEGKTESGLSCLRRLFITHEKRDNLF